MKRKFRVLLVAEHASFKRFCKFILKEKGLTVESFICMRDALRRIEDKYLPDIDFIVADMDTKHKKRHKLKATTLLKTAKELKGIPGALIGSGKFSPLNHNRANYFVKSSKLDLGVIIDQIAKQTQKKAIR